MSINLPTIDPVELLPRLWRRLARLPDNLDTVRDKLIVETLSACDGNVSETARRMGAHRRTIQRRITAMTGGERLKAITTNCSAGALHLIDSERRRRELPSRSATLDAILAEWSGDMKV